jgi:parallel beta-helix repeat protein
MKNLPYFLTIACIIISVRALATEIPGGNVSGTWTLSGSPYNVNGDITIPLGSSLTIEAGVNVIFTGYYKMNVAGQLTALGTSGQQIHFSAISQWHGLRILNSNTNGQDSTRLVYCHFGRGYASGSGDDSFGGAVYCNNSSDVLIRSCTISYNSAQTRGGAIYLSYSNIRIERSFFLSNDAGLGGAIYSSNSSPLLNQLTLTGNNATTSGGAIYKTPVNPVVTITNSILWNNSPTEIYGSNVAVNYSDIMGGYTGTGNIDLDPEFKDYASPYYSLMPCSPCIDTGNPSLFDPDGTRIDMGAFYFSHAPGSILASGNLSGTLTASVSPYYICGDQTVVLGATLTIEPGVEIRFTSGLKMDVYGRIIADGTSADSIKFTSWDPSAFAWRGISIINSNSNGQDSSVFNYCQVKFVQSGDQTLKISSSSDTRISNSTISGNNSDGITIWLQQSDALITHCDISNNSSQITIYVDSPNPYIGFCQFSNNSSTGMPYCIYCVTSSSQPEIEYCTFDVNGNIPVRCYANAVRNIHDNTYTGNIYDYLSIEGSTINFDSYWENPGIPYRVTSSMHIYVQGADGADGVTTLTIEPGTTVQFSSVYLWIGHDSNASLPGALVAEGTPDQKITFTSSSATPAPGNWFGLYFANYSDDSKCSLENCVVEYGGASIYENIYLNNASPSINTTIIRYGSGNGIAVFSTSPAAPSSPVITGCQFSGNSTSGISSDLYSLPSISGCTFDVDIAVPVMCYPNAVKGLSSNIFTGNNFRYIYVIGGTISLDSYWENQEIPFYITGNINIQGTDGADNVTKLSIEPGAVLKFNSSTVLTVGHDSNSALCGALNATGTDTEEIIFTAMISTPSPGYWGGIYFADYSNNSQSRLEHCTVEYGGYSSFENLVINNASPSVVTSTFRYGSGNGIYVNGYSNPFITGSVITGNTSYGLYVTSNSTPNVTGCTFDTDTYVPIYCFVKAVPYFSNNTFTGTANRYIWVEGGTISWDAEWENPGIPYRVSSSTHIYVQGTDGADGVTTLTLAPGTILQFGLVFLWIGHDSNSSLPGALHAIGTPDQPITFTSSSGTSAPGAWYGLYFANYASDSDCRLEHCIVEYGGNSSYENIYCNSSAPSISFSESRFGSGAGIMVVNSANMNIDHTTIRNNTGDGIRAQNSSLNFINNTICSNTGHALYLNSPLSSDVRNNIISENSSPLYLAAGNIQQVQMVYNDFWLNDTTYWSMMPAGFGLPSQTNFNGDICDVYYNIFLDPEFENGAGNDYHITEFSPCINAGDPDTPFDQDGTISDQGVYCFDKPGFPDIISVQDVPNDQGKQVQVVWQKSLYDETGTGQIEFYSLWREDDLFEKGKIVMVKNITDVFEKIKVSEGNEPDTALAEAKDEEIYWDNKGTILTYLASIPAMGFNQYSYIAPTLFDSCAASVNYTTFELFAHTQIPGVYYGAVPDSGYSVDNLAPGTPLNLTGTLENDHITLTWNPCFDPDLNYYALYKSGDPDNFPSEAFAGTSDTLLNDFEISSDTLYYKAAAYDFNGNRSGFSNMVMIPILSGITLDLKVFLGGAFLGPDMSTSLNFWDYLPLSQPYSSAPWNYGGLESVTDIPSPDITDWILIELRDALSADLATPSTRIARQAAFLKKNGQVRGLDGVSLVNFNVQPLQNLFVVIWHRNHIGVISASPVVVAGGICTYDFTASAGQVYGGTNAHRQVAPGIWAMTGGDGNADGQINNPDKNEIWIPQNGSAGYYSGDLNLDGNVSYSDRFDTWKPNTGRGCMVPGGL